MPIFENVFTVSRLFFYGSGQIIESFEQHFFLCYICEVLNLIAFSILLLSVDALGLGLGFEDIPEVTLFTAFSTSLLLEDDVGFDEDGMVKCFGLKL